MVGTEEIAALETAIYEAAVVPELWPMALEHLSDLSWTAGTALVCVNERGVHMISSPSMDEICRRFVGEGWMSRNTRAQEVIAQGFAGVPHFVTEEDIFEPERELTDPMINELLRPYGFGRGAGFITELPHGDTVIVNVEQFWDRGHIRGEHLETLNHLYPHLARATLLAGRSDFARVRTAIDTLTALDIPAVAVTPTGKVVLANQLFEGSEQVWQMRGGEKLVLRDHVANAMLTDSLATIKEVEGPRSIPVRALTGGPVSSVLQVAPIRRAANDIFGGCCAIVALSELKLDAKPATLVQSLFDLTATELAVARGIAGGKSVSEIARNSQRSVHTVRNQLTSIFSKTGLSRQAELAILVNQLSGRMG
ncbi:MAG: LuxR C-terminal-related transcriptional regulator [Devosia sp.]